MKTLLKILKTVFFSLAGLLTLLSLFKEFFYSRLFTQNLHAAASIGVIGGADGPTAIFVARPPLLSSILGFIFNHSLALALGFFAAGFFIQFSPRIKARLGK